MKCLWQTLFLKTTYMLPDALSHNQFFMVQAPKLAHMKCFAYLHFSIPTILAETSCHFPDFVTNFQYIP
jgi:hypothetical protein